MDPITHNSIIRGAHNTEATHFCYHIHIGIY
jgi:hypothetical protein